MHYHRAVSHRIKEINSWQKRINNAPEVFSAFLSKFAHFIEYAAYMLKPKNK